MSIEMDKIRFTAEFLGRFSDPRTGFKFLTHGFDPFYSSDFFVHVNRCRLALVDVRGLIPDSLYDLLFGFLYGPSWTDADGNVHNKYCGCDEWVDWCIKNPGCHPMNEFSDFKAFKNSIRVYNMTFDDYVGRKVIGMTNNEIELGPRYPVQSRVYPNLSVSQKGLGRLDAYMDVRRFRSCLDVILQNMNDTQFSVQHPHVSITCKREGETPDGCRVDLVRIEQIGSFPAIDIEQAIDHFRRGGGHLASLKNMMEGHFLWSLETVWGEMPLRWNILKEEGEPATERIAGEEATGFRHVIKIYHKV